MKIYILSVSIKVKNVREPARAVLYRYIFFLNFIPQILLACATMAVFTAAFPAEDNINLSSNPLPVEFDPDLVFLKPEKPLLQDLSPPALDEYKSFLNYLYRHDKDKVLQWNWWSKRSLVTYFLLF